MAAFVMQVNGFQFHGKVYIALDEGSDLYPIGSSQSLHPKQYIPCPEIGNHSPA